MEAHVAIWTLTLATWAFLIFNSVRLKLIRRYPLVFTFIFISIFTDASMPLVASLVGVTTRAYAVLYMITVTATLALAAIVLLWIYGTLGRLSLRRDWHLVVVPLSLIAFTLTDEKEIWTFDRSVNAASLIVTYFGIATIVRYRREKRMQLGWNLKMFLLAVTVPYVFQSVVYTVHKIGWPISYPSLVLWLQGSSLAAWIILAAGMIEYSPPTPVVAENSESGQTNGDSGRESTVGNLSETREQLC